MADSIPLPRLPREEWGICIQCNQGLLTRSRAHRVPTVRRGSRPFRSLCPSTEQTHSWQGRLWLKRTTRGTGVPC